MEQELEDLTEKLKDLIPLMAPELIEDEEPDIEINDDYSVLEYGLPHKHQLEDVMDIFEDDMDLYILYHCRKDEGADSRHHLCAISDPGGNFMYKVNAVTNANGFISHLTFTLYASMDSMIENVQGDLALHEDGTFSFYNEMSGGTFASLFAIVQ